MSCKLHLTPHNHTQHSKTLPDLLAESLSSTSSWFNTDVFRDDLDVLVGDADVLSDVGQFAGELRQRARVTKNL